MAPALACPGGGRTAGADGDGDANAGLPVLEPIGAVGVNAAGGGVAGSGGRAAAAGAGGGAAAAGIVGTGGRGVEATTSLGVAVAEIAGVLTFVASSSSAPIASSIRVSPTTIVSPDWSFALLTFW